MATRAGAGPSTLRELRRDRALTQAQLAERSGVSVRTIRGLETGSIREPHVSSLLALGRGMRLSGVETHRLVRAWTTAPRATWAELIERGVDIERLLADARAEDVESFRTVSFFRRAIVGANRRVHWSDVDIVVEALRDGVDHHVVLRGGDQSEDTAFLTFDRMVGCSLESRVDLPGQQLAAFHLSLGWPATKGETRAFSFRSGVGDTPPADQELAARWHALGDSDGLIQAFRWPAAQQLLHVTFVGCTPTGLWEVEGLERPVRLRELYLDAFGSTHIHAVDVEPGNYGIEWAWD